MRIKNLRSRKLKIIPTRAVYIFSAVLIFASSYLLWFRPDQAHAQTDTFTVSGTWTVPANVSSAVFEAWGGGGAGGGATTTNTSGGGGAGGQYAIKTLSGLITNDSYTVTVAISTAGGTGNGNIGSDSFVQAPSSSILVLAKGGAGGTANNGSGGTGSTVNGVGDTVYAGGSGTAANGTNCETGTLSYSGAGGGGAGSTGAGGGPCLPSGGVGTTLNGGNGGDGILSTSSSNGNAGSNYGGGGGGASKVNGGGKSGGAGAQGLVTVTYTVASNSPPNAPTPSSPSNGSTVSSTTPQFQMAATDPEGDHVEYSIAIYNTSANSGGNCTGTSNQGSTMSFSAAGWSGMDADAGSTFLSGSTATYTVQAGNALTRGSSYCWQSQADDPAGSTVSGSSSTPFTFTVNSLPSAPTLSSPSSGATGVSTAPSFTLSTTDADSDYVRYRIYLYQSDCSTPVSGSPFTQPSGLPQTGWSGQDAGPGSNTAYATTTISGTTATYTYQSTLSNSTTYCWKADAIDPGGTNTYSTASGTRLFTTAAGGGSNTVNIGGGTTIQGGSTIQ